MRVCCLPCACMLVAVRVGMLSELTTTGLSAEYFFFESVPVKSVCVFDADGVSVCGLGSVWRGSKVLSMLL